MGEPELRNPGDSFALDPRQRAIQELLKRIGPERARFFADACRIPNGEHRSPDAARHAAVQETACISRSSRHSWRPSRRAALEYVDSNSVAEHHSDRRSVMPR
jgi:hypothetical protein